MPDTIARLANRQQQELQAKQGLTQKLTIGGETRRAYAFLFESPTPGSRSDASRELEASLRENPGRTTTEISERIGRQDLTPVDPTTEPLSLEHPEQFSISWTNFPGVYESGLPFLPAWASSLTDADAATNQFWPMIAEHGFGYNLIIPERVTRERAKTLRPEFGSAWDSRVRSALNAGNLYVIDMSRFESLQPQTVNGAPRFTPATITLLIRNARRQTLRPVAIIVSGNQGSGRRVFARSTASERRVALRAPSGQGLGDALRHLARARLPLAHRHRGDADDDVQHAAGRSSDLPAARAAVEVRDPVRRRAAGPLVGDRAPHLARHPRAVPRAVQRLRRRALLFRRRSEHHHQAARAPPARLHEQDRVGPIPGRPATAIDLGSGRPLRRHLRRHHLRLGRRRRRRPGPSDAGSRPRPPPTRAPAGTSAVSRR